MFQQFNHKYPGMQFRYLLPEDYNNGLYELLIQLSKAPKPEKAAFIAQLQKMRQSHSKHIVIVGYDTQTKKLVATGTIIICATVRGSEGKIQNIVTCKSVRGKGYGKAIIEMLKIIGWKQDCQMINLFCRQSNVQFYRKLGFTNQGLMMIHYSQ